MENLILFIIFIMLTLVIHFALITSLFTIINDDWPVFYTPATFYKMTQMNWVGCIISYILLFPFGFVFEIGGFLKWVFTIGRKE